MPLDSLLKLVETLRQRIDEHGNALRQSEALTRYALIDPLLRELGWDTSDPSQVVPEYRVPNNQMADYVLLANGAPSMVVESKKLDEPLRGGKALDQGILYCAHTRSGHFLLSDGRRWELYEASSTEPKISFDLKGQSPAEACLKALALWKPSVESGHVGPGSALVSKKSDSTVLSSPVDSTLRETPENIYTIASPQPIVDVSRPIHQDTGVQDWQLVSQMAPKVRTKPTELMFPGGERISINSWKAMLVKITTWLIEADHLTSNCCPVPYSDRSKRYVVALSPVHGDGTPFNETGKVKIGSFYVDTKHSTPQIAGPTRFLIRHVGQNPAQFKVRFR